MSPLSRAPDPAGRMRLFCFPYAGAGASIYARWPKVLRHGLGVCPVELPGRGSRQREQCANDLRQLSRQLAQQLLPHLDRPFAFYGYSMGALLAFEAARELVRLSAPLPQHLFMTARAAPHLPAHPNRPRPDMADALLLGTLSSHYGRGIHPELLTDAQLVVHLLRLLRADLTILDQYVYEPGPPLPTPLTALGGAADPSVSTPALSAWRQHTQAPFRLHTFAQRQHFFLEEEQQELCKLVEETLS